MVGIPGVGKSFVSKKLQKYLSFYGVDTKVFNVGAYRRHMIGQVSSDFFDPSNKDQFQKRYDISTVALDDLISYVNGKGQVGILDTTITTIAKCRDEFAAKCEANDIRVVFIEIICEDAAAIERNIREVKSLSQDYIGFDSIDNVVNDFQMRIKNHLPFYEPLQDNEQRPYVKVMTDGQQNNFGDHILLHKINGYLETKIIYFLMNIQTKPKKIYLILPPDDRNLKEDVATESDSYAIKVGNKMHDIASESRDVIVYCAPRAYALDTCSRLPDHFQVIERTELSEMHPGEHSHLTMKDIEAQYPEQYAKYCKDPFKHRFPRAEVLRIHVVLQGCVYSIRENAGGYGENRQGCGDLCRQKCAQGDLWLLGWM